MRTLATLFVLFTMVFASLISIEEFSSNNVSEKSFKGIIYVDCREQRVDVWLWEGKEIKNATLFLLYNYGPRDNSVTDEEGKAHLYFTGKYDYITQPFQLRIDKKGYKKMLITFDVEECKNGSEGFYLLKNAAIEWKEEIKEILDKNHTQKGNTTTITENTTKNTQKGEWEEEGKRSPEENKERGERGVKEEKKTKDKKTQRKGKSSICGITLAFLGVVLYGKIKKKGASNPP